MTVIALRPDDENWGNGFTALKVWTVPEVYYSPTDENRDVDIEAGISGSGPLIRIGTHDFTPNEAYDLATSIYEAIKYLHANVFVGDEVVL